MSQKPKRWALILSGGFFLSLAGALTLIALERNITYFYYPSQIENRDPSQFMRIGGLVKKGSIERPRELTTLFIVEDTKAEIPVIFEGILPDLFREGQGVILEGRFHSHENLFIADEVLAKHDETYKPPRADDYLEPLEPL